MTAKQPQLSSADLVALRKALAIMRAAADPCDRQLAETSNPNERWDEVAASCAIVLQERNLGLRPWEIAPGSVHSIEASLEAPENDHRGHRRAARMLQRLLALGLSQWEPDPVRGVSDAEQAAALEPEREPEPEAD